MDEVTSILVGSGRDSVIESRRRGFKKEIAEV